MLKTVMPMIVLLVLLSSLLPAADRSEFRVYVWKPQGDACAKQERIPADASVLFGGQEAEHLDWDHQTFVLNSGATGRLLSNVSDLVNGSEEFVPRGQFPEAEGKSFAAVLNGKVLISGVVAGMDTLQHPPDCPLLYPGLPMVDHGKLVVGIGLPRKALREDFFKVLIEEGPGSCFSPVLPSELRDYFLK